MEKKQMKDVFDNLNPTKQQEKAMWERFSKSIEIKNAENVKSSRKAIGRLKYMAAASITVAFIAVSGLGINAATDGAIVSMIKEAIVNKPSHEDIVSQAGDLQNRGIEVYASDILYIDENWLVFGNLRGILIYDLRKDTLSGTIDTQAIDCMYFNGETIQTHVLEKNQKLILFNTKDEVPYGAYYEFDFKNEEQMTLSPKATGDDTEIMNRYYEQWKEANKMHIDTFDMFWEEGIGENKMDPNDCQMYSENSLKWKNGRGEEYISYLIVEDGKYLLNTYCVKTKQVKARTLFIESKDNTTEESLPLFTYTGDDMAIKTICEYMQEDESEYLEDGQVWIPNFIIFKEVKKHDKLLVFGNFYRSTYSRNGNMLEAVGGGEMPACFHLKQKGDGFEVESVDAAGDGTDYEKDIKAFTRGYFGLASKYFSISGEDRQNACKEYLEMYVAEHELPIQYYKEFGWDPVKLF